jgi:hypothetical protein
MSNRHDMPFAAVPAAGSAGGDPIRAHPRPALEAPHRAALAPVMQQWLPVGGLHLAGICTSAHAPANIPPLEDKAVQREQEEGPMKRSAAVLVAIVTVAGAAATSTATAATASTVGARKVSTGGSAAQLHVAKPAIQWRFRHSNATADSASTLLYWARHVPAGGVVRLQRAAGTAHVWRRVATLPAGRGSARVPGLSMGRYLYRIAIYGPKVRRHHRRLLAKQAHHRWVFDTVQLGTLLEQTPESVVVAGQSFPYVYYGWPGTDPDFGQTTSTCRSISLDIAIEDDQGTDDSFAVYHQSSDPTIATGTGNTIINLDSELVRGESWTFQGYQGGNEYYVNGTASCYSTAPFDGF